MNKLLPVTIGILLFCSSGFAQRAYQFRKSGSFGGNDDRSTLSANFLLGGLGGFGVAVGGEYEYIIDADGRFSVTIPFYYSATDDAFMTVADVGDRYHYYKSFYLAPGARFHPAGAFHRADFSLGVQLAVGEANIREELIAGVGNPTTNTTTTFVAPLVHLNLDICSPDGFVFGLYMGGGPVVAGNFGLSYDGRKNDGVAFFQMGIKLGGRF